MPSNTGFCGGIAYKEFEQDFNPALGFISRRGVADYSGNIGYTHRPSGGYWQSMYFVINHSLEDFDRDDTFRSQFSDATVKLNYTLRY